MLPTHALPTDYPALLTRLRELIRASRVKAALAVNSELVLLYWRIGNDILDQQTQQGWGAKIVDQLAADLRHEFPEMTGLSPRNLKYMRAFATAWPDEPIVQQLVAQIPWGHNVRLLDYVSDPIERLWYVRQTIENGWSRNVLAAQVESGLYHRQGRAVNNFERTLPAPQSDLARQVLQDPYVFDFLNLGEAAHERELESALLAHVQESLLTMDKGFALVGSQHHLEVGGQDFYINLLFYYLHLRCFVVVDLKVPFFGGAFTPEDGGKMNFYLSAVDDLLRHPTDQPTIGLILCKKQNRLITEYALRGLSQPVDVAEWQLTRALPESLRGALPTAEELEAGLTDPE